MLERESVLVPGAATLRRELRAALRCPRVYFTVAVLTGLTALLCASAYPFGMEFTSYAAVQYSQTLVRSQFVGLWLTALFALPAITIIGLHQDAKSAVLEQIAVTPLHPWLFYGSRAIALTVFFLLGTAAVLPISGIAFFLAGLEVEPYLAKLVTVSGFAVTMICLSVRIAQVESVTWKAAVRTAIRGLMLCIVFLILPSGSHVGVAALFSFSIAILAIVATSILLCRTSWRRIAIPTDGQRMVGRAVYPVPFPIPDGTNPITAVDRYRLARRPTQLPLGCQIFFAGFMIHVVSAIGYLAPYGSAMAVLDDVLELLFYGAGAALTALFVVQDFDRVMMDALRGSLLTARQYLNGKMRVVWSLFAPLLYGWYVADMFGVLAFMYGEPPLRVGYHFVLVLLNIPEFHIVFLLAATGATFGHDHAGRAVGALVCGLPGLLLPIAVANILEHTFVQLQSQGDYLEQFGLFVFSYMAAVAVALVLALLFARWRFARVWQCMDG